MIVIKGRKEVVDPPKCHVRVAVDKEAGVVRVRIDDPTNLAFWMELVVPLDEAESFTNGKHDS